MKKIINGKKYDTDTAELVGKWWNHLSSDDLDYRSEHLHRKRNGEFFLHANGGPRTEYCGGKITPMAEAEARAWSEEYLDGDEYEAIFGEVEE